MALEFSDLDLDEYQVGGTLCLGFFDVAIQILRQKAPYAYKVCPEPLVINGVMGSL